MIRTFERLSRELRRRVMLMIGRAVLTVVNDGTGLQTVQVEGLRGEVIDAAERLQLYGITSHPLPGADALVMAVGGVRQHPVVLIDDRRHRVTGLAEGEVCIYTDEDESGNMHRILMKRGREIEMRSGDASITISGQAVEVRTPGTVEVNCDGTATVTAGGAVEVNSGGAITLNSSGDTLIVQ